MCTQSGKNLVTKILYPLNCKVDKGNVKVPFCPVLPWYKNIALCEDSQVSPARPSDKSCMKMKMCMEHSRNDAYRAKPKW